MHRTVDQFPSVVRPPPEYNNCDLGNTTNVCSSKQTSVQTERTKYHLTNRSASLPSRQSSSPLSINTEENIKQRRRYASDSCNNNKHLTASIVTSFLQYLRSELRATTHDQTNDYERIKTMESSDFHQYQPQSLSMALDSSSQLSNDTSLNLLHHDDENKEISTLINLLILRVECLANTTTLIETSKKPNIYPSIKQIDQNLTEYLYYLFNKFTKDDPEISEPMIDKTNFVNVCQTLVRNGCFNMPSSTSPDQSYSEATLTNSNELTLIQPAVREYKPDADEMTLDKSSMDETISLMPMSDQDTWLVVDLEPFKPQYSTVNPNEAKCLLPTSTSDDQLLLTNENYFSFEEIKSSCGSESSHSNYFSPNSSLVDLQTMVQEFDEINNNNHNNNNNNSLFNEDGSTSIEHASNNTNVIIEEKDHSSNNDICTGLTNEQSTVKSNEQVVSLSSSPTMETAEQMTININGTKYRRDKKLQERWTITTKNETPNQNSPVNKANLGVEFPPIAVLRRKFSTLPAPTILNPVPIKRKDSSTIKSKGHSNNPEVNNPSEDNINKTNTSNPSISSETQKIRAPPTTPPIILIEDVPKSDQQSNNAALLINNQETKHDTHRSIVVDQANNPIDTFEMKEELSPSSSSQHGKKSTYISENQQKTAQSDIVTDLFALNSTFSSSSSSSSITNTDETKTNEFLLKETVVEEEEEKEKKEEEKAYYHDDNVDVKEKNNTTVERNYHASGMLLINDEPTQTLLLEQEKKEQHSTPSLTAEACNQQRPENDCSMEILSSELDTMINANVEDNEQRYKTIEIEEIPDEEEEQEVLLAQNNLLIEPIDYIVTDDEPRKSSQSKTKPTSVGRDNPLEFDPVISCYEKVLSKVAETMGDSTNTTSSDSSVSAPTDRNRRAEEDPIALRALQRFEQRMSAAVAAKTTSEEIGSTSTRNKSSWSGTSTTPRKSVENLFKNNPQLPPTSMPSNEDGSQTTTSPRQRDTFIRPRKSMLDDVGLSFNRTMNIISAPTADSTKDNHSQCEEQQQPVDISGDANDRVIINETMKAVDLNDHQQQESESSVEVDPSVTNETGSNNEVEECSVLPIPPILENVLSNASMTAVVGQMSSEQPSLVPYHLQLASRPRLNTLERFRDYRQNYDANSAAPQPPPQPPLSYQTNYNVKPEDLQDPIIRRALERFDEKSRSLAQSKPMNYDDIQDPITRRALMRLETNLKRTAPSNPPPITNESNETWYTNSYTLGSLQTNNDSRFGRYPPSSLPPTGNPKTIHTSVHQRLYSTSSDMPEVPAGNMNSSNDQEIPIVRVPTQPVYVTSNQQPISLRQRSRSEDMLSSREMSIAQLTNVDENDTSEIQRNHSSNQLASQETPIATEVNSNEGDLQLPQTITKSIDPRFVRTQEAAVNYATPTQKYSAYSCEYTRPHRTQSVESTRPEFSPRNFETQQQFLPATDNLVQYPTSSSSSAFTPVHPSTNNYYPQSQPLTMPSYNSMYTSNNPQQTPYSNDPIVRRALERFNSQMQNSIMSTSQHPHQPNFLPRQFSSEYLRHGGHESFYPPEPHHYDPYVNYNRAMQPLTGTNTGYQSIIGRRRQIRHDDIYHDNTNIGSGYTTPLFANSQNPYPSVSPYVNYNDEPPAIPPRLHRDLYHDQQEYQSENVNTNNNNNNNNNNSYIHYGYPPPSTNGFRSANHHLMPSDSFHQYQEEEYLRHRAQSTSSTTSSDSMNQIRLIQQRLPPTSPRTNPQQNKKNSPDHSQVPSGRTTPSNGSQTGDSVFQRLSHTSTKSSLSKSSSNLCANILNKTDHSPEQQNQIKSSQLKTHEIDLDDSITTENNQVPVTSPTSNLSKCQRSRSVDGRARLKSAQNRMQNANRPTNNDDGDHHHPPSIPSSKFTYVQSRYNAPPPRVPSAPRYTHSDRPAITKRLPNGHHPTQARNSNGVRTRSNQGNLVDTENDENLATNDNYQPKIVDSKIRPSASGHRYGNNNSIQTSASTSSVTAAMSRTKAPVSTSANLYRRDLNASGTDLNRSSKRTDDQRLLSPPTQRRQIPVSVFSPAKNETKRPAPIQSSSTTPINEPVSTCNGESHEEEEHQLQQPSQSPTGDSSYTTLNNENEMNKKISTTGTNLKSSTENILSELAFSNDRHDTSKKMNVFERLFRGHKKKV